MEIHRYGVDLSKKGPKGAKNAKKEGEEEVKRSRHVIAKQKYLESKQKLDPGAAGLNIENSHRKFVREAPAGGQ